MNYCPVTFQWWRWIIKLVCLFLLEASFHVSVINDICVHVCTGLLADRLYASKGGWSIAIILTSSFLMMSTLNCSHCSRSCQALTHTIINTPTSPDKRAQTHTEIMLEMFDIFVLHNRTPTLSILSPSWAPMKSTPPCIRVAAVPWKLLSSVLLGSWAHWCHCVPLKQHKRCFTPNLPALFFPP